MATTLTTGMVSTSQNPAHKQVLDMADGLLRLNSKVRSCSYRNLSAM